MPTTDPWETKAFQVDARAVCKTCSCSLGGDHKFEIFRTHSSFKQTEAKRWSWPCHKVKWICTLSAATSVSAILPKYMQVATTRPLSHILFSCFIGPIRNIVLRESHLLNLRLNSKPFWYPCSHSVWLKFHSFYFSSDHWRLSLSEYQIAKGSDQPRSCKETSIKHHWQYRTHYANTYKLSECLKSRLLMLYIVLITFTI